MALTLNLKTSLGSVFSIITDDCVTIELDDNTGNYDASDNPGGYGAPNDTRASVGLKLFVTKKPLAGDEIIAVTNHDDDDPGVVSKFRFTNTDGGRFNMLFCAIKDYNGGTTYADGEISFDPVRLTFYESLQAANTGNVVTDTAWWRDLSTLTEKEVLAVFRVAEELTSTVMYFTDIDAMLVCNLLVKVNRAILDAECNCEDFEQIGRHNELQMKADAVVIMEADGNYTEAQEIYESAMNLP